MTDAEREPLKVAVCIPSYGDWKASFCCDVIEAISISSQHPDMPAGSQLQLFNIKSSILPQSRSMLANDALKWGATHLWWLDCDMRIPSDALQRLLARKLDIVGANYVSRHYPHAPTAWKNGRKFSSAGLTGVEPVGFLGMGCLLMTRAAVEAVEEPRFMFGFTRNDKKYVGEDVYFFDKAARAGFVPHVDHDLSQAVKHIGDVEFDYLSFDAAMENHGLKS